MEGDERGMRQLKIARAIAGMTQAQLAEKSGVPTRVISEIENDKKNPTIRTLKRLAEAMDMELVIDFKDHE